jgi:streptogramin lyase
MFRRLNFLSATLAILVTTGFLSTAPARADSTDLFVGLGTLGAVGRYTTAGTSQGNFVSNGSGGISDPQDFTFGPDGNLYVAGYLNTTIKEYNGQTGAYLRDLGSGLTNPHDVAFDTSGHMYVTNPGNNTVSQILVSTGSVTQTYTGFSTPFGLLFNASGSLLVTNFTAGNVVALNTTTGGITPFATGFVQPRDIATGPDARLYVLNSGGGQIDAVNPDGTWSQFADINAQYPFSGRQDAQSLVYDNGNFYTVISSDFTPAVAAYNGTSGAYISSFALPEANVTGIATQFQTVTDTPEPGTVALLFGFGLASSVLLKRRKRSAG